MAQTWSREELVSELDSAYSKLEALLDGVAEAELAAQIAVRELGQPLHDEGRDAVTPRGVAGLGRVAGE